MITNKAVFETLLVINGHPIEATAHLKRLSDATGIDATKYLSEAAAKLAGYHRLRLDFTPPATLSSRAEPISKPIFFDGLFGRLTLEPVELSGQRLNKGYGPLKLTDRQELDDLRAKTAPAEPLLVDGSNNLLETSLHNVFIIENDSLVTPPLDGRILPGTTRAAILEEARKLNIKCLEEDISLERAEAASGMFLTNSIVGIVWVDQLGGTTWPDIQSLLKIIGKSLADRWITQTSGRTP